MLMVQSLIEILELEQLLLCKMCGVKLSGLCGLCGLCGSCGSYASSIVLCDCDIAPGVDGLHAGDTVADVRLGFAVNVGVND